MNIKTLCEEAHRISVEHGFWGGDKCVPSKLMLIVTEIAECCEADRTNSSNVGEELGDAVIRIADLAEYLGIDLEKEIEKKMGFNKSRPFRHGKGY